MKVEVKEMQSNEVDWTKNPQVVVDKNGQIVLVSPYQKEASEDCFCGTILNNYGVVKSGYVTNDWDKTSFKPFHGSITLSND